MPDRDVLTQDEMRALFRAKAQPYGGVVPFCKKLGLAPSCVTMSLHGERAVSAEMAMSLGFKRVYYFERIGDAQEG